LYFFYAGDFDSAAWLASQLPPRWADAARGSVPIAWPIDPELSLRFPPAFDLLLFGTGAAAPTRNDVLTAGDSGAGFKAWVPPRPGWAAGSSRVGRDAEADGHRG
jgi:hypothetical protein